MEKTRLQLWECTVWDRGLLCVKAGRVLQPNFIIVYLCVFGLTAACHFCFPALSVGGMIHVDSAADCAGDLPEIALACRTVHVGLRVCHCIIAHVNVCSCIRVSVKHICSVCVCAFLRPCARRPGLWRVPLHPWWASLSQMDGLSQCQRGDSWPAWPLLAEGLDPVLWQLLTAPDGWHVLCSPPNSHPPMSLHHGNSCFLREINDVSQRALMKCKWYEPHPGEMTPELISAPKEVATLQMIE